ncbi:MAG TPA: C25 family cysteine peptidase, partial [Vicinamibacteria bacterium]
TPPLASNGLVPAQAARIAEVAFQGEVKKALLELAPLRWDGSGRRLLFARTLQVTVSFRKREPSETATFGRRGRRERETAASRGIVARLATEYPGLHRVRYEDVFRETRGRGVDAAALRLSRLGKAVPFHLEPATDRFAPGSTLFFLSEGPDANPYGNEAVYELETGRAGERMRSLSSPPSGLPIHEVRATTEREEDRYYQAALLESPDPWLWEMFLAPSLKAFSFSLSSLAASGSPAKLEVSLQGASDFPESPDHHARLFVNGSYVGDDAWNGKEPRRIELTLPAGILREGENTLEIEGVADTGSLYSLFFLDRFSVTYSRLAVADDGVASGTWEKAGAAEVFDVDAGARVLDLSGPAPRWVAGVRHDGEALRFHVEAGGSYLVVDRSSVKRPEVRSVSPPRWKKYPPRADYVAIGPRDLLDAARPLLDHRRGQGLEVASIPVDEIFDEMGYGEKRPEAIRDFLTYAYHHWPGGIRYALLLGDASYDFKDHLGTGAPNRVPALPIQTSYLWTASDPSFAAVNGDDLLPDIAIGRLPTADASELRAMIEKILAYESGGRDLTAPVVLVTDNPDLAGDFDADARDLMASVLASRSVRHLSLAALGADETREETREAFDEGASVVSYVGHGGIHLWASENVLDNDSVALLSPQDRQPIVIALDCLNGYFHFPFFDSLGEELLKADGKGAVAVFAPSGLSLNEPAQELHKALLRELFEGGHERLGDAVLAAQAKFLETGAFSELLEIYHLFGDPALALR